MQYDLPRDDPGEEPTLAELIQLVRAHQSAVEELLVRVEKIHCPDSVNPCSEDDLMAEWNFTGRERHVAELLVEGLSNRRIARSLGISERTVKNHLHSIFYKLRVGDRTQAVIKLMRGP